MSITHANDKYATDHVTVSGREMSIKLTEAGYYRIDVAGAGEKPALCNEIFTSLMFARKALEAYTADNAADLAKKEMLADIAARDYTPRRKNAKSSSE